MHGASLITIAPPATGDTTGNPHASGEVTGSATVPHIEATALVLPTNLDFGDIPIGTDAAPRQLWVVNISSEDLYLASPVLSDTTHFFINKFGVPAHACGNVGYLVHPGASCSLTVHFQPAWATTEAGFRATLRIATSDPATPELRVKLRGTGASDTDGVSDLREMGASGGNLHFDGNQDGIPDRLQSNVASLPTHDSARYVTLSTSASLVLESVTTSNNPAAREPPSGLRHPWGFFTFSINGLTAGDAAVVTLRLPFWARPQSYWKYGPRRHATTPVALAHRA